eukprot:5766434-Prymnesium_polylepis.1
MTTAYTELTYSLSELTYRAVFATKAYSIHYELVRLLPRPRNIRTHKTVADPDPGQHLRDARACACALAEKRQQRPTGSPEPLSSVRSIVPRTSHSELRGEVPLDVHHQLGLVPCQLGDDQIRLRF